LDPTGALIIYGREIFDAHVSLLRRTLAVSATRGAAGFLLVCLSACGSGAPAPPSPGGNVTGRVVTGTERLGWNQSSPSAEELTRYRHWAYVDGVRVALQTQCTYLPSRSDHACSAPLPEMGAGRHVLELSTAVNRGATILESARSEPLVVIVAGAPQPGFSTTADVRVRASADRAAPADTRYSYEPVATLLRLPVAVAPMPEGNFLVGERRGAVKVVGPLYETPSIALDASDLRDVAGSEITLHGIALHPRFGRNAFVYVMYTEAPADDESVTRIARFRHIAGRLGERAVLLDQLPARRVDPGGALSFGADGKLYVATGDDGGAAGRSDPAVLAGKVLRLNDDGSSVSDNPRPTPVIFAGLHRPMAVGWHDESAALSVVDVASPEPPGDLWRQHLVSVHALHEVSSACVYRGTRFPMLNGKLVVAQGDSLRYIDPDQPPTSGAHLFLKSDLGRIQVVQADTHGFLYVGTGNTGSHEEVGRDVLMRFAPAHPGGSTPTPSRFLRR
jgi:glucose/arabinose dehydrogenase